MNLTPREKDKLLVAMAAIVARRHLERGVKLNHPEAIALITDFVVEGARASGGWCRRYGARRGDRGERRDGGAPARRGDGRATSGHPLPHRIPRPSPAARLACLMQPLIVGPDGKRLAGGNGR